MRETIATQKCVQDVKIGNIAFINKFKFFVKPTISEVFQTEFNFVTS